MLNITQVTKNYVCAFYLDNKIPFIYILDRDG